MPKKRRTGLIVSLVVTGILVFCGGGGAVAIHLLRTAAHNIAEQAVAEPSEDPNRPFEVGDCVRPAEVADKYRRTSCKDRAKIGHVIDAFEGGQAEGQSCGSETDLILAEGGRVACVRSDIGDHKGEPGRGGGALTAGDCVSVLDAGSLANYKEVPCSDPKYFERVVARVDDAKDCAAPAVRQSVLPAGVRRIVCLADGPGIAGPGECIATLGKAIEITFAALPCNAPGAGAKILARKPSESACDSVPGTTHWINDGGGLTLTKYVCVKELKSKGPNA